MIRDRKVSLELYTGLAVALLLLGSGTSGWIVFGLAVVLIVVGLVLFPDVRGRALLAVTAAALTGGLMTILRRG
jgi:hypothetical protein